MNVIALPRSVFLEPLPARVARRADVPLLGPARPQYVYGDSTPFQAGVDFIATIRALVACGVSLMKSQHAIDCARSRVMEAQEHLISLDGDLGTLASAVEAALAAGGPRKAHVRDVGHRVATMTRAAVLAEVRRAQAALDATVVRADKTIVEARKSAALSFGELLARHDLPGASTGFRIFATEDRYGAEVVVNLPCGLRATFDADLPEGHAWRALRRVRHAREGIMVTLPYEVGWFKKRVEPVTLRLDKLMILGASLEGSRGALLLGRSERSGIAHAFDVDLSSAQPRVKWRNADDTVVIELGAQDAACITKLLRAVEQATRELVPARRTMTDATLDARPLGQCDPGEVCARLVALMAADVREIARRAGAPGELVLRRNVDSGHRDEVFVTTAELLEQVETLPPSLRRAFGPLDLDGKPRSPRAPARSLATYEEISACEILPQA
ncbi:MAG TPA: hypothetical protein VGL81_04715 [Polyangiaceae bacterium]